MSSSNEQQYKVLVLCIPTTGHLNPMTSFIHELNKAGNIKCIFLGNRDDRELIESTGSQFYNVEVKTFTDDEIMRYFRDDFPIDMLLKKCMEGSSKGFSGLVDIVVRERIDMIIYDVATITARWFIDYLKVLKANGKLEQPLPCSIMFSPTLMSMTGVYPNSVEMQFMAKPKFSLGFLYRMLVVTVQYVWFHFKLGLKVQNPLSLFTIRSDCRTLCCVIPEMQPRHHLFPKTVTFVGSCAPEEFRSKQQLDEPLHSFVEAFKPVNPIALTDELRLDKKISIRPSDDKKLVYVSFGTIFNNDVKPYLTVIEAAKQISDDALTLNRTLGLKEIRFLMSTGNSTYDKLDELVRSNELSIPSNMLLMKRVPQLDVLKRASLFITHSGQNSTSEAIHFGVPMICLPVYGDQPQVAYRVADELGLGIRLSLSGLNAETIRNSIVDVLSDKSYLERSLLYAKLSRKHKGVETASRLAIEYLQHHVTLNKKTN